MDGLYETRLRFSLVAGYMDNPGRLGREAIGALEANIIWLMVDAAHRLGPRSDAWPDVIDRLTLLTQQRVGLESAHVVLEDDVVRERLHALREAWGALRGRVTAHEAEKMLRDPPQAEETPEFRALREAWHPISRAGERALAAVQTKTR